MGGWTSHAPGVLSHGALHVVHGLPDKDEEDDVGDEEGRAAVLVGQVREAPNIADADLKKNHNEY